MKKILKKEKGITLIALVVTIVVLLILAGISINAVLGDNGLITRAKDTKIEQAHAQVRDAMALLYGDYQIVVLTGEESGATELAKLASLQVAVVGNTSSFIAYLEANNIITDGIVDVEVLLGSSLSYGNGSGTSDVYKVEENSGTYQLKYYDKDGNITLLDTYGEIATGSGAGGTEEVEPTPAEDVDYLDIIYDEDTKTAIINGPREVNEYYNYYDDYTYDVKNGDEIITNLIIPSTILGIDGEIYTVVEISRNAFKDCISLESVNIPNSVTSIGDYAFYHCSGLTSLTIGNSVTSIGDYAFYHCSGLTSITIPSSVTSIGNGAFSNCSDLTSITIPNSVTNIGGHAFNVTAWIEAKRLENPFVVINGILIDGGTATGDIEIPNSVTSIGDFAFYGCSRLTSITIPNSVTSIGDFAFEDCSGLTSLTIGNSVTSIGDYAFYDCSGLTSLTIGNSVTSIGDCAFEDCSGLTDVTIPNSVTSIGDCAFEYCSGLTSLTIGNSVTSIGNRAFEHCSGLITVNYTGTQEQWDAIEIGYYNEYLTNATLVLNYSE